MAVEITPGLKAQSYDCPREITLVADFTRSEDELPLITSCAAETGTPIGLAWAWAFAAPQCSSERVGDSCRVSLDNRAGECSTSSS